MEELQADNPWRDPELNLPTQRSHPHQQEEHQRVSFSRTGPKTSWSECNSGGTWWWEATGTGEHRWRTSPVASSHSSSLCCSKEHGQDGRFHTEDRASTLPVLDFLGALFAKLCRSLLSSRLPSPSTDTSDRCHCFLPTFALQRNPRAVPRNAPHLNR